jgi:WD40 repeat protein
MYLLTALDGYQFGGGTEVPYVLDIHSLASGLASISSDQALSLFDSSRLRAGPVRRIQTEHGNVTVLRPFDAASSVVCSAGENGAVSVWDFRTGGSSSEVVRFSGMSFFFPWRPKRNRGGSMLEARALKRWVDEHWC